MIGSHPKLANLIRVVSKGDLGDTEGELLGP